jgi:hypothetical protein
MTLLLNTIYFFVLLLSSHFPESNTDEITARLNQLDFTDEDAFVNGLNTLIGELSSSSNYTCTNQCNSCFTAFDNTTKLCGLFSVEESSSVQNKVGNFSYDQILFLSDDDLLGLVDEARFFTANCLQYTGDVFDNSELCFIVDFMGVPNDSETVYCNITYNDVLCDSCIIPGVPSNSNSSDDQECIIADCTNVDATYGTMINLCQNIGLDGPFQYFALKDVVNDSTFTPGTCNGDATPTGPAPTIPTSSGPVTIPSPTTSTMVIPTSAPVLNSKPTTSDQNTTTTNAPIRASAPTPALSAPTSGIICHPLHLWISFLAAVWLSVPVFL